MTAEPTDAEVEQFISAHPDGANLDQIAGAFGVTRQRAQQLVTSAVAKALRALRVRGFAGLDDLPV